MSKLGVRAGGWPAGKQKSGEILVTGATGILGCELLSALERDGWQHVVGVARQPRGGNGRLVLWDIGRAPVPAELHRDWDVIINAAASTRWTMSPEEAYRANVSTVKALRPLAGVSTKFIHVSTAYAPGLTGNVSSPALEDYRNTYEWSKAWAERLIEELFVNAIIVRPTLIIGRRSNGRATRFAGIYTLLRGIAAGTIPAIVSTQASRIDCVPVDDLARIIVEAVKAPYTEDANVLTVANGDAAPLVHEAVTVLVDALNAWRIDRGCLGLEIPKVINPDSWGRFFRPFADEVLSQRQLRIIDLLRNYEPYLQMEDPVEPTHQVLDVQTCLARAARYWAETNSRVACLPVRPWKPGTQLRAGASL